MIEFKHPNGRISVEERMTGDTIERNLRRFNSEGFKCVDVDIFWREGRQMVRLLFERASITELHSRE